MAIPSIAPEGYWGEGGQGHHRSPRPAISPNYAFFVPMSLFFPENPNIAQLKNQKNTGAFN